MTGDYLRFYNQDLLWLLVLGALLIAFYIVVFYAKKKVLKNFGNYGLVERMLLRVSRKRQTAKAVLTVISFVLMIIALARPQIGTKIEQVEQKGLDIIIVMDVSSSMLAGDIKPSRLEKAKHELESLIDKLKGDRIGLIVFSGTAFLQCPLTLDYDALKIFLDSIDAGMVPKPGTAISQAIRKAVDSFDPRGKQSKVVILLTDGEDHEGDPVGMAKEAKKEGIRIYTIGIGSARGEPIPDYDEQGVFRGYKKNSSGNIIMSKANTEVLQKIALQTNGKFYAATPKEMELTKIYEEISKLNKKTLRSARYTQYEDRFQYFLLVSVLLLFIESILPESRRSK